MLFIVVLYQHNFKIFINLILNPLLIVFVKFHNMKQKKILMSPLNSTLFFTNFLTILNKSTIFTICPQSKFTNVQFFSFFFQFMDCAFFLKMVIFLCFFHAVFNSVQVSFLLSFPLVFFHCLVVFIFFFIINCSFTIFFLKPYICFSLSLP